MSKIYKLHFASVALTESIPGQLFIAALGSVRTSGWTNPRLNPRIYVNPPEDGIYDFDFEADPPTGPAPEVISRIRAVDVFPEVPAGFKGIRIHAETGSIEAFPDGTSAVSISESESDTQGDDHFPWLGAEPLGDGSIPWLSISSPQGDGHVPWLAIGKTGVKLGNELVSWPWKQEDHPSVRLFDRPVPWPWSWGLKNYLIGKLLRVLEPGSLGDTSIVPGRLTLSTDDRDRITNVTIDSSEKPPA